MDFTLTTRNKCFHFQYIIKKSQFTSHKDCEIIVDGLECFFCFNEADFADKCINNYISIYFLNTRSKI